MSATKAPANAGPARIACHGGGACSLDSDWPRSLAESNRMLLEENARLMRELDAQMAGRAPREDDDGVRP